MSETTETVCPSCSGSGWKSVGNRVTRCDCRLQMRAESLLAQARIPERYKHCEVANYQVLPGRYETAMLNTRLMVWRFVEEFPLENNKGLLLLGPIGTGKTHLAVGLAKELSRQKGVRTLFYDYRELLKEIQNSYNPSVQATEMDVLRPVMEVDVLVLDELGAIKPSEWVWDTVSHILNTRYNEQRTTIITTNLEDAPPANTGDGPEVASAARRATREATLGDRITERMRSRLHEMCRIIRVDGDDYRQRSRTAFPR